MGFGISNQSILAPMCRNGRWDCLRHGISRCLARGMNSVRIFSAFSGPDGIRLL
jgi:hypothetical protein